MLTLVTGISENNLAVLEFIGYSQENGTVKEVKRNIYNLKELLKKVREDNRFGIQIANIPIEELVTGQRSKNANSKAARCYRIPLSRFFEEATEDAVEQYIGVGNAVQTPYSYVGWKQIDNVDIARVYVVEHYNIDGKEVWYYNKKGLATQNMWDAAVATRREAENTLMYRVRGDSLARVKERYIQIN